MEINLDFDGTVVSHEFPKIGNDIGSVNVLHRIVRNGHKLILFTMRSDIKSPKADAPEIVSVGGNYLTDAVNWFKAKDIPLYGIQSNPTQHSWTTSPKSYAQLMIDDTALGAPLVYDTKISKLPFIDWVKVEQIMEDSGLLPLK